MEGFLQFIRRVVAIFTQVLYLLGYRKQPTVLTTEPPAPEENKD